MQNQRFCFILSHSAILLFNRTRTRCGIREFGVGYPWGNSIDYTYGILWKWVRLVKFLEAKLFIFILVTSNFLGDVELSIPLPFRFGKTDVGRKSFSNSTAVVKDPHDKNIGKSCCFPTQLQHIRRKRKKKINFPRKCKRGTFSLYSLYIISYKILVTGRPHASQILCSLKS